MPILSMIDVLIAGRFVEQRSRERGFLGSSNQILHFLTDRYTADDFAELPDVEVHVGLDGTIAVTGVRAPTF